MEETIEERYKRYDILFANQIKNGLHIDLNIDDICKELAICQKYLQDILDQRNL